MCLAIEEMRTESRLEGECRGERRGEMKGAVETYKEVGFSFQETIQRIAEKFSLSLQHAEEEVKKYWK